MLFRRLAYKMMSKKIPVKQSREPSERSIESLPDIALAAIASYEKQKDVSDFMNFLLESLERNSDWLNGVVSKQNNFRCAFMVGAGPNRFQQQGIIYPSQEEDLKLEVELKDSEDYDKIAIAALLKLSNQDIDILLKYIKTRSFDNTLLKDDLLKGKAMGLSFAVLRPLSEKQFRVMERIVIGSPVKCPSPVKRRRKEENTFFGPALKKTRRITGSLL